MTPKAINDGLKRCQQYLASLGWDFSNKPLRSHSDRISALYPLDREQDVGSGAAMAAMRLKSERQRAAYVSQGVRQHDVKRVHNKLAHALKLS